MRANQLLGEPAPASRYDLHKRIMHHRVNGGSEPSTSIYVHPVILSCVNGTKLSSPSQEFKRLLYYYVWMGQSPPLKYLYALCIILCVYRLKGRQVFHFAALVSQAGSEIVGRVKDSSIPLTSAAKFLEIDRPAIRLELIWTSWRDVWCCHYLVSKASYFVRDYSLYGCISLF